MKCENLQEVMIEEPQSPVVVELPNGQRVAINRYEYGHNKCGENIIVLQVEDSEEVQNDTDY